MYTEFLGVEILLEPGTQQAHEIVNNTFYTLDRAIAGLQWIDLSSSQWVVLSSWESTAAILRTDNATAISTVEIQAKPKTWVFINDSPHEVDVIVAGQASPAIVPAGTIKHLVCDGSTIRVVG